MTMFHIQRTILQMMMAKWLKRDYVIIDTESTGLLSDDEIIEITIINMRGDVLLDTLVKPTRPIPPDATKINNITDEMVADAPTWPEVFPLVKNIITGRKWLAWNSSFDARMMVQSCLKTGFLDSMKPDAVASVIRDIETNHIDAKATYDQWYGEFDKKRKGFKRQRLTTAAERHGIEIGGAHRALADCMMVLGVLEKVCEHPHLQENTEQQNLPPCPFCYGPPSLFTHYLDEMQFKPLYQPVNYGDDGLYVGSYVFCHECGAQGEEIEAHVYDDSDVHQLEEAAKNAWSNRDDRHRELYVSNIERKEVETVRELNREQANLVMLVKQLAHSIRTYNPDSLLAERAMKHLKAAGLISVEDILR